MKNMFHNVINMDDRLLEVLKRELKLNYEKSDEQIDLIIDDLLSIHIKEVIKDSSRLSFVEFYSRYLSDESILSSGDFLTSEIERIIQETPLTDRDKKIAKLRYEEKKSEDEIADILQIDKKTVHTNISKISTALRNTCRILYKKH